MNGPRWGVMEICDTSNLDMILYEYVPRSYCWLNTYQNVLTTAILSESFIIFLKVKKAKVLNLTETERMSTVGEGKVSSNGHGCCKSGPGYASPLEAISGPRESLIYVTSVYTGTTSLHLFFFLTSESLEHSHFSLSHITWSNILFFFLYYSSGLNWTLVS